MLLQSKNHQSKRLLSSLLHHINHNTNNNNNDTKISIIINDDNNRTIINNNSIDNNDECWSEELISILYQSAYICLLIAYLLPTGKYCLLFIHLLLLISNLLLIIWITNICIINNDKKSILGWSITFLLINIIRISNELYQTRHIKFNYELEQTYSDLFENLGIKRKSFKMLCKQGKMLTINSGELYAIENITINNRLALLISGKMNVMTKNHFLHTIEPGEFLDSPEWDSCQGPATIIKQLNNKQSIDNNNNDSDNRFHVSLIAVQQCRLIYWNQIELQLYLIKDKQMMRIINLLIGRDITNKLYSMNANILSEKGSILDIRLPVIITSMTKKQLNYQQQQQQQNNKQENV